MLHSYEVVSMNQVTKPQLLVVCESRDVKYALYGSGIDHLLCLRYFYLTTTIGTNTTVESTTQYQMRASRSKSEEAVTATSSIDRTLGLLFTEHRRTQDESVTHQWL